MIIENSGTANNGATVDANGRLFVDSLTLSASQNANDNGDAYNINTGEIILTTTANSGVLYVKNNENIQITQHRCT